MRGTSPSIDVVQLLPAKNWERIASEHAEEMEKADEVLFNRLLGPSDAPHRGKKTGTRFKHGAEVNLFLPYGSAPPPPPKPLHVHYHDEAYYRQFLHPGHDQHRREEERKMIEATSCFEKNFGREGRSVELHSQDIPGDDGVRYARGSPRCPQAPSRGILDDLLRDSDGRREGKRIHRDRIGLGVLNKEQEPIPGFAGVGVGNREHLAEITPKALTPAPTYDPLGLNAQKQRARERLRATSTSPSHVFEPEYGTPPHISRRDPLCHAKTLMVDPTRHAVGAGADRPDVVRGVRQLPNGTTPPPAIAPPPLIPGFGGMGFHCSDDGVPRQTGLKHVTPECARSPGAPHTRLRLHQAHQEAYTR